MFWHFKLISGSVNLKANIPFVPIQATFHDALGLMGIENSKPTRVSLDTIKMPPLDQPLWFEHVADDLEKTEPPIIGPQVS